MFDTNQKSVNPLVYVLVAWFGSITWLGPFTALVELPILTRKLPEEWALGSILSVSIEVSYLLKLGNYYLIRFNLLVEIRKES
jgi:hypothetical protein